MLASLFTAVLSAGVANAQVTAAGTMGVTNPTAAIANTPVNQTSMARLISLNSINDFCIFAPPEPNSVIGETEAIEVAWCVQPRNNARVIPDGTFTAVHFVKTPLYWQIQGLGDFTKLNIAANDNGGELDPHGATGKGNPEGGNVTTNATGSDVSYEEWMNYMSYQEFCLRICISENSTYSAANECQHTLDEMGCSWVMPGDYTPDSFTECDGDSAYPPGWYPQPGGSISTFAQRYTGTNTANGATQLWTIGQTVTPSKPAMTPATSNCITHSSIGNGIPTAALSRDAVFTYSSGMSFSNLPTDSASASSTVVTTDAQGHTTTEAKAAAASDGSKKSTSGAGRNTAAIGAASFAALVVSVVAAAL